MTNAWDSAGRQSSTETNMDGTARGIVYGYDADGDRTALSTSAGFELRWSYDSAGRMTGLLDAMGTSAAVFTYDAAGRRSGLSFLNGVSTVAYGYDALGRLSSLTHDFAGTSGDQSYGFTYNAASQIVTRTGSNDSYASNTAYPVTRGYTVNGLNQYTAAGPATFQYDANANLTNDGSTAFVYDAENRLVSAGGTKNATLSYDPLGRLWQVAGASGTVRFFYDGDRLVEEYDASGNRLRMFAHGQGADELLGWWEKMGGWWQLRFLHADHQGSIVSMNDVDGNVLNISPYDTWGIPNAGNWGRFGYTGQVWLGDLGLYYYKARMYSPTLGRFMQTDPIGYKDEVNLYAYVGNDPVDGRDPSGQYECAKGNDCTKFETYRQALITARDSYKPTSAEYQLIDKSVQRIGEPGTKGITIAEGGLNMSKPTTTATIDPQTAVMTVYTPNLELTAHMTNNDAVTLGASIIGHEANPDHMRPMTSRADRIGNEVGGYSAQEAVSRALGVHDTTQMPAYGPDRAARILNSAMNSVNNACKGSQDPTCI